MTWLRSVSHASADLSRRPRESLQATRTARYKTLHAMRCNADSDCGVPRGRPGCDAHYIVRQCCGCAVLRCAARTHTASRTRKCDASASMGGLPHAAQACSQAIGGIGCCRSLFARAVQHPGRLAGKGSHGRRGVHGLAGLCTVGALAVATETGIQWESRRSKQQDR